MSFSYIDGDGLLVVHPDRFAGVDDGMIAAAEKMEAAIRGAKAEIEERFILIAYYLDIFDQQQLYKARGYETMRDWANSPEIEIGWRTVQDLLRIRREMVPILEANGDAPTHALAAIGVSKARAMLPLLRDDDGADKLVALAQDAPAMTWPDVRQEVRRLRGVDDPIDQPSPALFKARVRRGEEYSRVEVSVTTGIDIYRCGVLTIRNAHMPRFEDRFGHLIEWIDA